MPQNRSTPLQRGANQDENDFASDEKVAQDCDNVNSDIENDFDDAPSEIDDPETQPKRDSHPYDSAARVKNVLGVMVADGRISDGAFRTLLWLILRQGKNDATWVSLKTLAEDRGISSMTICRHLRELRKLGWLTILRPKGKPSYKEVGKIQERYERDILRNEIFWELLTSDRTPNMIKLLRSEMTWAQFQEEINSEKP